jgi:glycine/D-amino acid oxidase-like deaminating enzyme
MLRILAQEEQKPVLKKAANTPNQPWISDYQCQSHPDFPDSTAWLMQKQCAWLDLNAMLDKIKQHFSMTNNYINAPIKSHDIHPSGSIVQWKDITARQVIFCEGGQVSNNHWFSDLPLQAAKGEIIDLSCAEASRLPHILNNGFWLLQKPDGNFRLGATHQWKYDNERPSEQGLELLQQKANILLKGKHYKITQHQAAIRPASRDKQPWIGAHPQHPQIKIFNGLGGRGGFFAPAASQYLCQNICHNKKIPEKWDVRRFYATC